MTDYIITDRNGRKKKTIKAESLDELRRILMSNPPKSAVYIAKETDAGRRTIGVFSSDTDGGHVWRSEPILKGVPIDPFTGAIAQVY